MPRFLRYFRITWTVFCVIACVLLIALWVRSYEHYEQITNSRGECIVESWRGRLWIFSGPLRSLGNGLHTFSLSGSEYEDISQRLKMRPLDTFGFNAQVTPIGICFPHWFASSVLLAFAALPWIRHLKWRFSLQTLLIATTLVAVVLGLIVWLSR